MPFCTFSAVSDRCQVTEILSVCLPQSSESLLSAIFEKVIIIMVVYFVVSIVNSMAQSYHKRLHRPRGRKVAKD